MKKAITIMISMLGVCSLFGQENQDLRFKGFVDTYHAVRVSEPNDFMASRSRFRGEIDKISGNSYFFASINAVHNNILPELTGIRFREAYFEYTGKNWGFKAGRQIIIWGKADGLRITDVISPMDLTEFLAQDYDDIRLPVNAIILSKFKNNWNLELICVPVFEGYIMPGAGNPWSLGLEESGFVVDEALTPDFRFSNMEYGGKLSFYLPGIDFDISALHTWNKAPVYHYYIPEESPDLHVQPRHDRLDFFGLGFSKSLNAFIIRGEGAFYFNKKFSPDIENYNVGLVQKNSHNYLLGVDWYPGNEWTVTGQFSDEFIFNHAEEIAQEKHTLISTLGISKKLLRSTLSLSSFAYAGLNHGDFFNRTSVDYSLSDNIHVMTGFDWFHGDNGVFGIYRRNSEVWVKGKYCF